MDDATLTSSTDVRMMDRHILEQLLMIRPLLRKEGSDAAAADDGGDAAARGDVVKEIAKECMALSKGQSKDLLLAVLLDALLLHLLDDEEEGRVVVSSSESSDQQLMDGAAAAKKKVAAAAKKKRNKRNKAAAKQKHKRGAKFMAWMGGGIIPRIMMLVVVGSITTLIFAISLIHHSDGSSEGNAPPTLPPSTITSLRQRRNLQSSSMPSTPPNNIMSPSPVPVVAQPPTPTLSPTAIERNALSDFYYSAGGPEWTDRRNWMDESTSHCYWYGVTCDDMKHVTNLTLTNNGLSGRLSESIGNLTYIEVLDLSDNDIKGSIPAEIGKLSNLTYLRLSYNAFTGAVPESLGELKGLQLLQLQSNRMTEMPNIPRLDDSKYGPSTFVADRGLPYAFDCYNCTMCCNANDDCSPQEDPQWGFVEFLILTDFLVASITCCVVFCIMAKIFVQKIERNNLRNPPTPEMKARLKKEDEIALSKICSDSVYSYFLTDNVFGWLVALVTLATQVSVLCFFTMASDASGPNNFFIFDSLFTWKCPRDHMWCYNTTGVTVFGWVVFCLLMFAFLAKDWIGGCKLIYHSTKLRLSLSSRIRCFFGGMCLIWITLFAVYASAVYSNIISKNTTELIVNSVIILFIMELDEKVFSALTAYDEKWTAHADDGEMKELQEIVQSIQESQVQYIYKSHKFRGNRLRLHRARMLREIVQKIPESQAAATTTTTTSDTDSEYARG